MAVDFFPEMLEYFISVAGLVRISKMGYLCKDLSFLKSLLNIIGSELHNLRHRSILTQADPINRQGFKSYKNLTHCKGH